MRATYEAIRFPERSSLKCWYTSSWGFCSRWHFHAEIEILFVERGRGQRFVGDHVDSFCDGDLVLLGPNLPHVWFQKPSTHRMGDVRAVVVQFPEFFLGREFWETSEFVRMAALIKRSRHGIFFSGADVADMAALLLRVPEAGEVQRVLLLLDVLDLMARSRDQSVLCSTDYVPKLNHLDAQRIGAVQRYIQEHLLGEISQPAAAALVRMSPTTFSHFFRQKMGRTFSAHVNQLRISHAIHLMVEEELSISEAAFASGFNNLSTFNHQFRSVKKVPPSAFLQHLEKPNAR